MATIATSPPPRLRADLTVQPQSTPDGVVVIVKDPVTGDFYRFQDAEFYIASQCDGQTSAETIRLRTERRYGATLTPDALAAFLAKLEKAHVISNDPVSLKPKPRLQGGLLRIRYKVADPDRLFSRMLPHIGFLFTPEFLALSAITILVATATAASGWGDIRQDLRAFYTWGALPLFALASCTVVSLHEFAHGLTCKRFGGEVHEIGAMLIYFTPAFYCNVSDAWLLPEKSKRLWVSFAGPYFELFLWALSTLVWRATQPDTAIHLMALMVVTTSGLNTLLNFNPFIKLDGYYLLADWLEIPNLRRQAFRYVGTFMERAFGSGTGAARRTGREHWVLLAYGLTALSGTFAIVLYVLTSAGGYLLDKKQPLAVVLSIAYIVLKLRRRFLRLFGKSGRSGAAMGDDDDDADGFERTEEPDALPAPAPVESLAPVPAPAAALPPAPVSPPEPATSVVAAEPPAVTVSTAGPPPPPSSSGDRRAARRRRKRLLWGAVALAAVLELAFGHMVLKVKGPFAVLPLHNEDVRAAIDGLIADIPVHEGDRVAKGAVIARLDDRDLRAELAQTDAQISRAQAKLALLQAGATPDSISLAKTAVDRAQDDLRYATQRLVRAQQLDKSNLVAHADLEAAEEQQGTALHAVHEAEGQLRVLLAGARPEELDAARADVAALQVHRQLVSQQLALTVVRSPAPGVVATPQRQLEAMMRQLVTKGALIAKVYELKTVTAEITVPEKEVADVQVGEEVALKTRAYPDETFSGRVTSIATAALNPPSATTGEETPATLASTSGSKTVLVTSEIDNPALLLKPGMTGEAKIIAGDRKVSELVRRRLARTIRVEFWSWW